jgi:hypothetical protein
VGRVAGSDVPLKLAELHLFLSGQSPQDALPQFAWDGVSFVQPDESRVGATRFAKELLGVDGQLAESKVAERDQRQAYLFQVADALRRDHVQEEASVVSLDDDGV